MDNVQNNNPQWHIHKRKVKRYRAKEKKQTADTEEQLEEGV